MAKAPRGSGVWDVSSSIRPGDEPPRCGLLVQGIPAQSPDRRARRSCRVRRRTGAERRILRRRGSLLLPGRVRRREGERPNHEPQARSPPEIRPMLSRRGQSRGRKKGFGSRSGYGSPAFPGARREARLSHGSTCSTAMPKRPLSSSSRSRSGPEKNGSEARKRSSFSGSSLLRRTLLSLKCPLKDTIRRRSPPCCALNIQVRSSALLSIRE